MKIAPLAIIGIGVNLPEAKSFDAFKDRVAAPAPAATPMTFRGVTSTSYGKQFGPLEVNYKKFAIPPIYRRSISSETYLIMQAVEDALTTVNREHWDTDKVDVFCGTCMGFDATYNNETKVEAVRHAAAWVKQKHPNEMSHYLSGFKQQIANHFGANSHDRVGEMASSIPARVSSYLGVQGKCQTIEAMDATGVELLQLAADTLNHDDSEVIILTSAQRYNLGFVSELLAQKGIDTTQPAHGLGEGAICLIVKRLADAQRDNDTIHAVVENINSQNQQSKAPLAYRNFSITAQHDHVLDTRPNHSDLKSNNPEHSQYRFLGEAGFGYNFANQTFLGIATACVTHLDKHVSVVGHSINGMSWHIALSNPQAISESEQISARSIINKASNEAIAIVGYSPLLGSCFNKDSAWSLLSQGRDLLQPLLNSTLNHDAFYEGGTAGKLTTYNNCGTSLGDLEAEVAELPFKIMPAKYQQMDALHKASLIAANQALDGIKIPEKNAVIMASNLSLKTERALAAQHLQAEIQSVLPTYTPSTPSPLTPHTFDGMVASAASYNIGAYFGLNAQCYNVEAACASSLAALHNSVRALQSRRVDMVVTGGFEFPTNERDLVLCSAQMMLSQSKIAPFSANADGFSTGDGGGLFVLKRLSDAEKAGDTIVGVIDSVSGSCDARSMTAPDPEGQAIAIRKTLAASTISPEHVQFIEAHGTGTTLGDASEVKSIALGYADRDNTQPLYIGSIKSNIGHCFAGSGSASLTKVLLSFEHQQIPATILRGEPNTNLNIESIPAEINFSAVEWPSSHPLAAINSFGTGGINYHMILHAYH